MVNTQHKQKRHSWSRGRGWMVCVDCGCRYRTGNFTKEYEQPDGERTLTAGPCIPRRDAIRRDAEER